MTSTRIYLVPQAGDGLAAADLGRAVDLTEYFIEGSPSFIGYDVYANRPIPSPPAAISVAVAREQFENRTAGLIAPAATTRPPTSIYGEADPAALQRLRHLLDEIVEAGRREDIAAWQERMRVQADEDRRRMLAMYRFEADVRLSIMLPELGLRSLGGS